MLPALPLLAFLSILPVRFLLPMLAVIDSLMGAAVGCGVLVLLFLGFVNRDKIMGSSISADPLVATVIKVLNKIDTKVLLSPVGRMGICGIAIFLGKVTALLPDTNTNKAKCLDACKTVGETFSDPTIAPPAPQQTQAAAANVK